MGKPESDEQFESLFGDLVTDSKARRLVIFVDEIDRCSADEVVATLDAIRTFLGADKCVFIVAADQHVLEESLTQAAKQETPTNEVNPYYSTGSAYLDKVFQYQVSLPPLHSQRITRFAADLVDDREGLWSEIASEYVVSVLVPTHVTSPRRVKHLLNAFALSYRLAEERHGQGLLSVDPRLAAPSLAKLVCLRVEFPLFARDLQLDANLPQIVLHLIDAPDDTLAGRNWSAQAIERGRAYACSKAAPASLMADDTGETSGSFKRTVESSNQQLLDYLRRTKAVAGPSRDLVYMHSTGAAFGLDGALAQSVEQAAETADIAAVARQLAVDEPGVRRGIIDLLNHLMRTSVGLGAPNIAYTLLSLYGSDSTLPVAHVADAASESIAFLADLHKEVLDDDTAEAAWNLASNGNSDGAEKLREAVLLYLESVPAADASFIMRHPEPALAAHRASLALIATATIVRPSGQQTVSDLGHLSDDVLLDLLQVCRAAVAAALNAAFADYRTATQTPPTSTTSAEASDESAGDLSLFDPAPIVQTFTELARGRISSPGISEEIVLLLLGSDVQAARDAVEGLLPEIGPVSYRPLVEALLSAAQRRSISLWAKWFDALSLESIGSQLSPRFQAIADTLWKAICNEKTLTDKTVSSAINAVRRLVEALPPESRPELQDVVAATLKPVVIDEESAHLRMAILRHLESVRDAGLVDFPAVCRIVAPTLHETLQGEFGTAVDRDSQLASYLFNGVATILREGAPQLDDLAATVQQLVADVRESQWYEQPFSTELQLMLIQSAGMRSAKVPQSPSRADITALIEEFTIEAATAAELWLRVGDMDFEDVRDFVTNLQLHGVVNEDIAEALKDLRRSWSQEQREALVRSQIDNPDTVRLTPTVGTLIGVHEIGDGAIADILIDRFGRCHNNPQRRALVDAWRFARLSDDAARRRMITAVVIGLLAPDDHSSPGQGQVEIALDALNQLGDPLPYGIKTALGSAVKLAVTGRESLEQKAVIVLEKIGYTPVRRGWFGLKKGVDYAS